MNKKLIIGSVVAVLIVGIGLTVFFVKKANRTSTSSGSTSIIGQGANFNKLAACGSTPIFTAALTTLADFDQIRPLGQVGVPDHTFPTDHMYFSFKHVGDTVTNPSLFAPGNIVVTEIMNSGETINGVKRTNDYAVTFSGCKDVSFTLGHVETLSGALKDAVSGNTWDKPCEIHAPAAGEETFYCTKTTDIALSTGTQIGTVGGSPQLGAFDLGAHKKDYTDPGLVRPERYPSVNAVCPLDYFSPELQTQLYSIVKRTGSSRCGIVGQDVAGTIQGDWFSTTDLQQGMSDWNTNLSFVHHNIDPTVGVVGVAGVISSSPMAMMYHPAQTGSINLEPSLTKIGSIYCYQNDSSINLGNSTSPTGKVLVELTNATTLSVEHKDGACGQTETFTNPTTYYR